MNHNIAAENGSVFESGLYVHVPFCLHKCDYCGFYSQVPGQFSIDRYLDRLSVEAAERIDLQRHVFKTVFVGGGNPTCIGLEHLKRLVDTIMSYLPDKQALQEWTFESNPETLTREMVDFLATLPSIRLSIGIQRLRDDELSVLGRRASMDSVNRALDTVFSRIKNVGGDFIMGVPGCLSLAEDLHVLVKKYPFSHISAYFLTVEANTPLQKAVASGLLPDPADIDASELYEIRDALLACGFEHYEISNYARPGLRCLHNLNYWQAGGYIGLGPAAVSSGSDTRLANVADLARWLQGKAPSLERLSQKDRRNEHLMLSLRLLRDGLDTVDFERHFGRQADEFYTTLAGHIASGNLLRYDNRVRLTDQGLRIADEIMASLFI
ncbi:MAG: hypothetical protein CVV41_08285 [Candidatus Riflebacteria bacterium HGW-Riflebacteria-1]|jgi:oxygen-independent coproporphyrinogen-3 oxidase|nr:MAG: hypothetical protein CVV41_08285 [Candidatus Riflebacteria bacterium HGW-Riflebacteria-1]